MKKPNGFLLSILIPAFGLAMAAAAPVFAQDKAKEMKPAAEKPKKGQPVTKVLIDNERIRVVETSLKPGDESASVARPYRIVRVLKGGSLQRTYDDGKVEKFERKAGFVREAGPDAPYKLKNVGKTEVVFYVVSPKQAKK